ncbi:hypothetical protein TrCOL_g8231 [Triparma columacea]|uniref:Uncharacterized protein n=1 Tax=Triparma columacea TaxID=722753 RepID=A0A9W7G5W0_9STRA|nr:hypothetical protein TrCOL_g8231 [Triparma columacea]
MGNTSTRSQTAKCDAPPPPPQAPPSPGEAPEPEEVSIEEAAKNATAYTNPGPFEALSAEAKRFVFVDTFDGARLDLSKQLSPMMMINHNFWLGTSMLPNSNKHYTFTSQVVADEDQTAVLVGRLDMNGTMEGRVIKTFRQDEDLSVVGKFVCVATPEFDAGSNQLAGDVDISGKSWSGNVKYGCMGGGDYFSCNYLQAITPRFCVGGEAAYIGAQKVSVGSYGCRYNGVGWMGSAQWSGQQGALSLNYKKEITKDRVNFGAELQVAPTLESNVVFGAEFNLKQSKVSTVIDGGGGIKTVVEAKLHPAANLQFSAEADHLKDTFKFGYGMTIMG